MKLAMRPHPHVNGRCPSERRRRKFLRYWAVLFLLILASCAAPGPQQVGAPTLAPSPSPSVTVTPSPTATHRPTSTPRPTVTPTPTARFPLTYEAAPTVTPAPEVVAAHARELACAPPCWFGLEPGVSTLQDVLDLWGKWSDIYWEWVEEEQRYGGYIINAVFYIGFDADHNGVLTAFEVNSIKPQFFPEYRLESLLQRLGEPESLIRIFTWAGPGGEPPPDTSGTLAFYFGYPSAHIVIKLTEDTEQLGNELPSRFKACTPEEDPYGFHWIILARPASTYTSFPEGWGLREYSSPQVRFLTPPEEIWRQLAEGTKPFCVDLERMEKP